MKKKKFKILSTKILEKSVLEKALANDIVIEQLPFITIELIQSEELKKKLKGFLQQNITAVFTSKNAVKAFEQIANASVPWKIFSLGSGTKNLVSKTFGEEKISGTADNAGELAEIILQEKEIKNVVFFCGNQRREELPAKLKEKGIEVEEVIVYETRETPQKITGKYDGILFFSPSAVKSFLTGNKFDSVTQLFAIGDTTAEAVVHDSKKKVLIAEVPTEDKMIDTVRTHFSTIKTA